MNGPLKNKEKLLKSIGYGARAPYSIVSMLVLKHREVFKYNLGGTADKTPSY